MKSLTKLTLIAPCGINCSVCMAYLREKNKCPGCRADDSSKPVSCVHCKIKNCSNFKTGKAKFCFDCKEFPCAVQKHLDKRYRTRYNMSTIENLENIKNYGIRKFVRDEKEKWTCTNCGGTICVHKGYCISCGTIRII